MTIVAYVLVTLKSGSEKDVCKKISNLKEVLDIDELYGEYDAIAKVRVDDVSQLDNFLTGKFRTIPEIILTTTMIVAKQHKRS